ncbi:MAG: hypothetical protein PHX87_03965 [Candidatus Peribacteraceae bacterium]|nr:hypothetical protein [Candidatus Peribacteraceae bacterium]MDD5742560.1 hypothetical protein [Candidatus Peribacteraceae bacterium]
MLHAFANVPRKLDEEAIKAIQVASHSAQILHNHRAEMLAFLDACWNPRFGTQYGRPTFETSAPHNFRLIREQWGLKIVLWYADNTGRGLPGEGMHLNVSAKDPERVRQFAHEAARGLGHTWFGALHYEDGHSSAPGTACGKSVDHVVDALIEAAAEKPVA